MFVSLTVHKDMVRSCWALFYFFIVDTESRNQIELKGATES